MSSGTAWWNCEQTKKSISESAATAISTFTLGLGIENKIVYSEVEIVLGPLGSDSELELVWVCSGGQYVVARTPYQTRALVVINAEDLGDLYFMFSGNTSEAFDGVELNPLLKSKSAVGLLREELSASSRRPWHFGKVAVMRFTKIEIGLFEKYAVPRGVGYAISKLGDIEWRVFRNQDEFGEVRTDNPLFSLLNLELQMDKKSHFASNFRDMEMPKYIQVNPRGGQTIVLAGSTLPLEKGNPNVVATELEEYERQWYLAVVPQPSLIRMNYDMLRELSELAGVTSTKYEVYSGVLDTKDSLPYYLAIELERLRRFPDEVPISINEISDDSRNSRGQDILESLKEKEPRILWPQKLKCTNCKAIYKYHNSDSKLGQVQCKNCLKYFPINQV